MKREQITTYNAWRGIAAVMILFSHMSYLADAVNPFWHGFWTHFMHNGGICSSFFFIVSGFFLDYSWKNQDFKTYLKGKLKRIYPLTLIVFLLALAVDVLLSGNDIVSEGVTTFSTVWFFNAIANVFLFKAFIPFKTTFYSFHGPSWYISVLFVFYIVAYWFVKGIKSDNENTRQNWLKTLRKVALTAYILQFVLCIVIRFTKIPTLYPCYINPYFRIFGEGFAGILLCEYADVIQQGFDSVLKKLKLNYTLTEFVALVLFLLNFILRDIFRWNIWSAWLQIVPMGLVLITFRKGNGAVSEVLTTRPFMFLGAISFELYMTHAFVYEGIPIAIGFVSKAFRDWIVYHAGTRFVITFIACIAFAWGVHCAFCGRHIKILFKRST